MNDFQYMTQILFGQAYTEGQQLTEEQQGQVMVLEDLALAYMDTQGLNFQVAVQLAHEKLPEDRVVNSELGFQLEMTQKQSDNPMAIIKAVEAHVGQH